MTAECQGTDNIPMPSNGRLTNELVTKMLQRAPLPPHRNVRPRLAAESVLIDLSADVSSDGLSSLDVSFDLADSNSDCDPYGRPLRVSRSPSPMPVPRRSLGASGRVLDRFAQWNAIAKAVALEAAPPKPVISDREPSQEVRLIRVTKRS